MTIKLLLLHESFADFFYVVNMRVTNCLFRARFSKMIFLRRISAVLFGSHQQFKFKAIACTSHVFRLRAKCECRHCSNEFDYNEQCV